MDIMMKMDEVWKAEQEILDVFHRVCTKNNLKYSLAYGTLLGAVRHGGFIPWDDDIDIMMPREDYEKLLQVWSREATDGYILQNYNTDDDYTNNFAKIRKNHTTFIQTEEEKTKSYHKGIFIDIFPGDRVPNGKIKGLVQYMACAVNLLYSRGYTSGAGGIMGKAERLLLSVKSDTRKSWRTKAESIIRGWNKQSNTPYIFACTIECCKKYYPSDMFDEMSYITFQGKQYLAVKDVDTVLTIEYGDYMQLPPENERKWKHHPVLIDFERNYEEIE